MRRKWSTLLEAVQKLIDDDATVINGLRNSREIGKIRKNFDRNLRAVSNAINELDVLIPDPERQEVLLPFDSVEFSKAWQEYKEYLFQAYQIVLVEIEERRRLQKLYRLSSKTESVALEIIDFLICNRYKSIFKPKDMADDQPAEAIDSSILNIQSNTL